MLSTISEPVKSILPPRIHQRFHLWFDALNPPTPCNEDLYERRAQGLPMPERLPRDLKEAVDALEANTYLVSALGPSFCSEFIQLKRAEWDAYSLQVSAWELEHYADAF